MTEADWLSETSSHRMLIHLGDGADKRKLRLFCVRCVARIEDKLASFGRAQKALEVAERYACGQCTEDELVAFEHEAKEAIGILGKNYEVRNALRALAWTLSTRMDAIGIARSVVEGAALAAGDDREAEYAAQADLLREILGNPFR